MHTVRKVDLEPLLPLTAVDHLVDTGGAEILARVAVLLHASGYADVKIRDLEVSRLVLVVMSARIINIGQLVVGQFVVVFETVVTAARMRRQLLHVLVAGLDR